MNVLLIPLAFILSIQQFRMNLLVLSFDLVVFLNEFAAFKIDFLHFTPLSFQLLIKLLDLLHCVIYVID